MPNLPTQSFLVLDYRGLPLLSLPDGQPEMIPHALRCLPAFSLRRRLHRGAILATVRLIGSRILLSPTQTPLPFVESFPFRTFLAQIQPENEEPALFPVVTFPSDLKRQRFYISLLSADGVARSFVKALVSDLEESPWEGELEARRLLRRAAELPFVLPRIHLSGHSQGAHFVVMEALPARARPLRGKSEASPRLFLESISQGPQHELKIALLPWWKAFLSHSDSVPALRAELMQHSETTVKVAPAHGDFQRPSIYTDGETRWLVDWEDYSEFAPTLLDELRFFLGDNTRALARHPRRIFARAVSRFEVKADADRRLQLALALAYLCSRKNDAGLLCGAEWNLLSGETSP